MSKDIKELFGRSNAILPKTSVGDLTGSDSPIESSKYIEEYTIQRMRTLPTVDFSTSSNFAFYGSAEQYADDSIKKVYNTYPYDGSATEKIEWLNQANFYDLYLYEHLYPRTCGYAVFSPDGWGTQAATVADAGLGAAFVFGLSSNPEYVQLKAGPHPDPEAASKTLAKQFPEPWDGTANVWDNTSGVNRVANIVLDPAAGITTEFWFKKSGYVSSSATSRFEYIFDVWNGQTGTAEGSSYGRYSILHDGTSSGAIKVGMMSGSQLLTCDSGLTTSEVFDNEWHHIAIAFQSGSDWVELNTYFDGEHHTKKTSVDQSNVVIGEVTGSLIANIGAARIPSISRAGAAALTSGQKIDGYAKLSGSIDEFRFWKTARTPKQIKRFWFTQIAGGTNTDNNKFSGSAAPVDLGFYYKFNEGNTGNTTTDATVLDYSGRISNGTWTGFVENASRITGSTASAMIESSASLTEFRDPIIYSTHPDVGNLLTTLTDQGKEWDVKNNSALYHTMPEWITTEDRDNGGETLKKLIQIIGSYFDQMHLQIAHLPSIVDKKYPVQELIRHNPYASKYDIGEANTAQTKVFKYFPKAEPYAKNMVADAGMVTPDMFANVEAMSYYASRDEHREFEKKLYDVKNTIYQNLYNNLEYVYRSKGTEKSFRNLLHCWGVDDDIINLNLYASDATYRYEDSEYHSKTIRRKYINFATSDRAQSTIYQTASFADSQSYLAASSASGSITFEADVIFPFKQDTTSEQWYQYDYLTSSVFGCHQANASTPADFTWASDDDASFQVYALRSEKEGKDVRFMLTSSNGIFPTLTSPIFEDVYDNNRWNLAVRLGPGENIGGSKLSGSLASPYLLEFYGVNAVLDQVQNSFHLEGRISATEAQEDFMRHAKRVYAGAHRTNFSGSNVVYHTDIKLGGLSVWEDYLSNEEIKMHAYDPANMGRKQPYESAYLFERSSANDPNVDGIHIPKIGTQVLNWQFENITGSSNGIEYSNHYGGSSWNSSFEVTDMTSGSDAKWNVPDVYKTHHPARGDWFLPNDTGSVDLTFVHVANQNLPERLFGEDQISILTKDDEQFTRDSRPVNYYFSLEKSMANAVSKEMLDMIGSAAALNDLIGEPVNRYRQEYKSLEKVREMFFRKVSSELDFNRFIDFYKWLDHSLSEMLMELVPATANFSDGVKNMIESHIFERNKYWTKFPTLEMKSEPITGYLRGIKELTYDWEHGHAPVANPGGTSAKIEFTFTDKPNEGSTIRVIDAHSTAIVFEVDDTEDGVTGTNVALTEIAENGGGGTGTAVELAAKINASILDITATNPSTGKVVLTQNEPGSAGNKAIITNNASHWDAMVSEATFPTKFAGGEDTGWNSNCLWWSERSEASGSVSGVNAYDDQRNTIRRITTSDITTNKIIATGEYTHPTSYPNSGLTNAAQYNLAQSGSTTSNRQEYKGSTYALRRFSKPYVMDEAISQEIKSGYNTHRGNKGVDVLWAVHRQEADKSLAGSWSMFKLDSTLSEYSNRTPGCKKETIPEELIKKRRSAGWVPYLTSTYLLADQEANKSLITAPFVFHSQSADITTGRPSSADTNTAYTGIHGDSYGPDQEIPMQGPFAERHVGGRAYRHADINDGTDDDRSRKEGYRIYRSGRQIGPPTADDHLQSNNEHNPRGWYYREETAKRPLNIRNIQTLTSSQALGNYEHIQQVLHTNLDDTAPYFVKLQAMTGSDGITTLNAGRWSLEGLSDTPNRPKLKYFARTLLDSSEVHVPPFASDDEGQLTSKHIIIERFSAPGGPDTAGDSGGGFGLAGPSTNYSPNNSLNYRNLAVRTPYHNLLVAHGGQFGSFSGSALTDDEDVATAMTASFHKTHRNTDYRRTHTAALTAFTSGSIDFDGSNDYYYRNVATIIGVYPPKNLTLSAWVHPDDTDSGKIFQMGRNASPYDDFYIYTSGNRVFVAASFGSSDIGQNIWRTDTALIKSGHWHNITVVWDQGARGRDPRTYNSNHPPKIYVDGNSQPVSGHSRNIESRKELPNWWYWERQSQSYWYYVGYDNSTSDFDGKIQDISLWNRPLTPSEVKNVYHLPGYDSAGPGDLNLLDYVTNDPKTNSLQNWWKFGPDGGLTSETGGTTKALDFAPIQSHGTYGSLASSGGPTLSSDHRPAKYYGIACTEVKDNWYIQHPIPANEFGYAWITASADKDVGCDLITTASFVTASDVGHVTIQGQAYNYGIMSEGGAEAYRSAGLIVHTSPWQPTDFAGMNTHIYEPVTASSNTLGYPALALLDPHNDPGLQAPNYGNVSLAWQATAGQVNITEGFFNNRVTVSERGDPASALRQIVNTDAISIGTPWINAINNNRGGVYGYPSWKQIRTGNHPVARAHKKQSILSVGEARKSVSFFHNGNMVNSTELLASSFQNFTEPMVSSKYQPMVHMVDTFSPMGVQPQDGTLTLKHTYGNNLAKFANKNIDKLTNCIREHRQTYHDMRDAYVDPDFVQGANPITGFRTLVYGESIYPKEQNSYLANARQRTEFKQTVSEKAQVVHGRELVFWRDDLDERIRCDHDHTAVYRDTGSYGNHLGKVINSMGYEVFKNYNQGSGPDMSRLMGLTIGGVPNNTGVGGGPTYTGGSTNERDLDSTKWNSGSVTWFLPSGALSSWPLDTGPQDFPYADNYTPSSEQWGYKVGELYMDPVATIYASLSTTHLNAMLTGSGGGGHPELYHFMAEHDRRGFRLYLCPGTASVCFNHFQLAGSTVASASGSVASPGALHGTNYNRRAGEPNHIMSWKANEYAGRNPFHDSYEDFIEDVRAMAKDYTILPEFKISDHMDHYLENGFRSKNFKFLNLPGASHSSSADNYDSDYTEDFWKEYCHSDFMRYFGDIQDDHASIAGVSSLSFKCSVVKKLLPYNGFYPVQRSIQMASLLSQSYGPYIKGSTRATHGSNSDHTGGKYFAEQMQSLLQPFYAPGIMYNTMKSCVAVDYPVHTGSKAEVVDLRGAVSPGSPWQYHSSSQGGSGLYMSLAKPNSRRYVNGAPTFRMPFEAIINPHTYLPFSGSATDTEEVAAEKGSLWLTAPYYGSSSFYCQWEGQYKPQYSMAANNFFAEIPNFFLETRTFNTFTSAKEANFLPMQSGSTYYMDVQLHKTHDFVAYENFGLVEADSDYTIDRGKRGWGYGPSYLVNNSDSTSTRNASDPSWAPHTPPYFYGASIARIKFTPHEQFDMGTCDSMVFSLDDILAGAEVETDYLTELIPGAGTRETVTDNYLLEKKNTSASTAAQHQMRISSSVNLFGKTYQPAIEYDANGNIISAAENPQAGMGAWVIGTKFECPSLNFYGKHGGAYDIDANGNAVFPTVPDKPEGIDTTNLHKRVRGLFNGLGTDPKDGAGIWLSLKESFDEGLYANSSCVDADDLDGKGSLLKVCGFEADKKRIGAVAEQKTISEAVVAIPFVDLNGERKFFALGDTPNNSRARYNDAFLGAGNTGVSIQAMVDRMQRYVFPPHLDFKTYDDIEPFAMYIFEFSHSLSKRDLSYIWQGLMPDISVTAKKSETSITHLNADNEFFRGNPIPENTRWMVFKVKRRARDNYFAVTADSKDDSQFSFKIEGKPSHPPEYTYNWPYDYFSLVEVAKLDVKAGIGDGAIPVIPQPSPKISLNPNISLTGPKLAAGLMPPSQLPAAAAQVMINNPANPAILSAIAAPALGGSVPPAMLPLKAVSMAANWAGGAAGGPIVGGDPGAGNTSAPLISGNPGGSDQGGVTSGPTNYAKQLSGGGSGFNAAKQASTSMGSKWSKF